MRGGDQGSGAIHTEEIKSPRDDERLTIIHIEDRHLRSGHSLAHRGAIDLTIENSSNNDDSITGRLPGIIQADIITLLLRSDRRLQGGADQFLTVATIWLTYVIGARRCARAKVHGC